MCQHSKRVAFLVCLTAVFATGLAQGPVGTLNGTILDQSGAVVPGATVVAVNSATAVESKTTSTSAGAYTLPYLPSGTYTIRVTAPGFRTSTAENVILRVAQDLTVNINLEVGQVSQQVTVSDQPPLIDTGSAMDEIIFQEFKGTGNMELVLDRRLADRRVFPAIDISQSETRKEERLLDPITHERITLLRRSLTQLSPVLAMEGLIQKLGKTESNAEFLEKIAVFVK